jgi:hypothetical protein
MVCRTVLLFLIAALSFPGQGSADDFYTLVSYECLPKSDEVIVAYKGEYGQGGREMVEKAGPDAWNTDDLVILDRGLELRTGHKTVMRECPLTHGHYEVTIQGFYWNANPAGECGYRTTAFLRIVRDGKTIYEAPFEAHCRVRKDIVTKVLVRGDRPVAVTRTSERVFFKW